MDTPQKKLKTFNITYRENSENPYSTKTVTYSAKDMNEAKELFYKDYPEQRNEVYLEIHSPLSNYEVEEHNRKIEEAEAQDLANYDPKEHWDNYEVPPENTEDNNTTTTITTTTTSKFTDIQASFQILHVYMKSIVLLLVGIIALSLVVSAVFGPNTPFYSVVENIGNIVSNINNFSGFLVVMGLTAFLTIFYTKN